MKKAIILLANIFFLNLAIAQDINTKKETFEENRFSWEEFSEKTKEAKIQNGYLTLKSKKEEGAALVFANFPLRIQENFKITYKLLLPKIDDKNLFGLVFNYDVENDNYSAFLLKEKYFCYATYEDDDFKVNKKGDLILKGGSKKEVIIDLEKKGAKLIFSVNGMQVYERTITPEFPCFGFYTAGKSVVMVDEISIYQLEEE
jgi:hypothetical protein